MELMPNYKLHPAFSSFTGGVDSLQIIATYFSKLDNLWELMEAADNFNSTLDVSTYFINEQKALFNEIIESFDLFSELNYKNILIKAFDNSANAILREIIYKRLSKGKIGKYGDKEEVIKHRLETESAVGFHVDEAEKRQISIALSSYMKQLRHDRVSNNGARCCIAIPAWGDDWKIVKSILSRYNIESGISAYAGYPLELVGYALTYSHPEETWYTKSYEDLDLSPAKTVQFHFDEDNISAKSMLYLNDVGIENGPFSYLPKQKYQIRSRSQISFFKYLDFAHVDFQTFHGYPMGMYNRALFAVPELRGHFARLPKELQGSSCLGDDILNNTDLSNYVIKHEEKVLSSDSSLALFAGGETLHRGGIVKSGERWALQMIYKDPPSIRDKVTQKIRMKVKPLQSLFKKVRWA